MSFQGAAILFLGTVVPLTVLFAIWWKTRRSPIPLRCAVFGHDWQCVSRHRWPGDQQAVIQSETTAWLCFNSGCKRYRQEQWDGYAV